MNNYDLFSKTFSQSRRGMKWSEVEYFLEYIQKNNISLESILDIWCWSGRLLEQFSSSKIQIQKYLGIDGSNGMIQEARKNFSEYDFMTLDMQSLWEIEKKGVSCIFFIASFHHLETVPERIQVLKDAYDTLRDWGYVFLTNWNLLSWGNIAKYNNQMIEKSQNEFGSEDFSIKIGKYNRYYHWFSLKELQYIISKTDFEILENRVFEGERNIITILRKK